MENKKFLDEIKFDFLKNYKNSSLQKVLFPEVKKYGYKPLVIPIGVSRYNVPFDSGYIEKYGRVCQIEFNESHVSLLIGMRGSGKTFLLGSIASRSYKSEVIPVFIDLKGEYVYINKPLQKKFSEQKSLMLKDEEPEGIPVINLVPYFSLKYQKFNFDFVPVQISFDELTINDFYTLVKREFTDTQREAISKIFSLKEKGKIKNFYEMLEKLKKMPKFNYQTIKQIDTSIRRLIDYGVIGSHYNFDVITPLKEGKAINLVLKGMPTEKKSEIYNYYLAYVALLIRKIFHGKENGLIPKKLKILTVLDEASRFIPNKGEPSSKHEIKEYISRGRYLGLSIIIATQVIEDIDPSAYAQLKYIFLSYNVGLDVLKRICKEWGVIEEERYYFSDTVKSYYRKMTKNIRTGHRDWMLIFVENKNGVIFRPLAPLFYHLSE